METNAQYKYQIIKKIIDLTRTLSDEEHWKLFCFYDDLPLHLLEQLLAEMEFDVKDFLDIYKQTGNIIYKSNLTL